MPAILCVLTSSNTFRMSNPDLAGLTGLTAGGGAAVGSLGAAAAGEGALAGSLGPLSAVSFVSIGSGDTEDGLSAASLPAASSGLESVTLSPGPSEGLDWASGLVGPSMFTNAQ